MNKTFNDLGLSKALEQTLSNLKYMNPTPIQEQAIPIALTGNDILGSAQTGTGKTFSFVIPLIQKIATGEKHSALILTPTRELASQVISVVHELLGNKKNIFTALLIGGEKMSNQLRQLKRNPQIIVGTPGRINDHLKRRSLKLHQTDMLVLDETDRMLDMGFGVQIETIINRMPKKRQTLMFSATLPKNIVKASEKYLSNPTRIEIKRTRDNAIKIKEDFIHINEDKKYDTLIEELEKRNGTVILFVKTKRKAEKLSKRLTKEKHSSNYVHGDLKQRQREAIIKKFRNYEYRIMVATDLAARGLDIPHIEHVINYDLPQCPEDYTHRIGRTGRAGAEGSSLCMIASEDRRKWKALQKYLNISDDKEDSNKNSNKKRRPRKRRFNNKKQSFRNSK